MPFYYHISNVDMNKRRIYSEVEKNLLVELVSQHQKVIEQKDNSTTTLKHKNEAWDTICHLFNSSKGVQSSTTKSLKKLWDNIKSKAKKEVAMEKKEKYKTGGGPPTSQASETSRIVSSLCSDVLAPLENNLDDDTGFHDPKILRTETIGTENSPRTSLSVIMEKSNDTVTSEDSSCETEVFPKVKQLARKKNPVRPTSYNSSGAFKRSLEMQEIEHELVTRRLRNQIEYDAIEHNKKVELLNAQKRFLILCKKLTPTIPILKTLFQNSLFLLSINIYRNVLQIYFLNMDYHFLLHER